MLSAIAIFWLEINLFRLGNLFLFLRAAVLHIRCSLLSDWWRRRAGIVLKRRFMTPFSTNKCQLFAVLRRSFASDNIPSAIKAPWPQHWWLCTMAIQTLSLELVKVGDDLYRWQWKVSSSLAPLPDQLCMWDKGVSKLIFATIRQTVQLIPGSCSHH